jgi:hypothetical protein
VIAESMAFGPSNDYWIGGEPWLILSPEHAQVLARAGWDKSAVRCRLWEASRMPAHRMAARDLDRTRISRRAELGEIAAATLLPIATHSDNIGIIVAGGPGTHSVYVPTFGDTRSVTRAIGDEA